MNEMLPIIGGPMHGGLASSYDNSVIIPSPPVGYTAHWMDLSGRTKPDEVDFSYLEYRIRSFSMRFGSLSLEGKAWVYMKIPPETVPHIALGLLIANAMGAPDTTENEKSVDGVIHSHK